jgi:GNAT superfamily N-acetyltransferase
MTVAIRRSRVADAPYLPAIERSAGNLYRTIPELAWIADGDDMSVERHLEFIAAGTSWLAETDSELRAGFLSAEVAVDTLHIWELAVSLGYQRQGIGRALMERATRFARLQGLSSITLTTFRSVAWNEPIYTKMGFVTLKSDEVDPRLASILEREISGGFPRERRCAMRMALALPTNDTP